MMELLPKEFIDLMNKEQIIGKLINYCLDLTAKHKIGN